MVGQGALRECLLSPDVRQVVSIVRATTGQTHEKLREIVHRDFLDFSPIAGELAGFDACFFSLGVSSAGMKEEQYTRTTYEIALAAARVLVSTNPQLTFIYISGAGTDSSEHGRVMWARVKGKTENALLRLGFKAVYLFRPGFIQPLYGIRSKTRVYRALYAVTAPLFPLLRLFFPKYMTTTEQLGQAMLRVARDGYPKAILESSDISAL